MDKLYSRRQILVELYQSEETGLMKEFEVMKKGETKEL